MWLLLHEVLVSAQDNKRFKRSHGVVELHTKCLLVKVQSWTNTSLSLCDKTIEESRIAVCDLAGNSLGVRVVVDCNSVCYS